MIKNVCIAFSWDDKKPRSVNMQNKGYAERTGLNHPIQSSAAEAMKLASSRVSDYVFSHHLSPIWGNTIPQTQDGKYYTDILYHPCGMIHDEIDFLVHKQHMDEVIPPIYQVIELQDVFRALGFRFNFEMDLEFDLTYSFTSTSRYPTSRAYVLMSQYSDKTVVPNSMLVDISVLTKDKLSQLALLANTPRQGDLLNFTIVRNGQVFNHKAQFTEQEIQSLGIEYKLAYIEHK